ncbi:MAG TPA: hypothetical protein VIL86_01480 [Tepidisphaeraceae bacterium]
MGQYWVRRSGDERSYGPYEFPQLQELARDGHIAPDAAISTDEVLWNRAGDLQLFDATAQTGAAVIVYATPVVGYATPIGLDGPMIWRENKKLVTRVDARLPELCVKCNAPGDGRPMSKKFYWHHPALFFLIIAPGLLIYAIVAMIVRKSATVEFCLCRAHRAKRRRTIWLSTLGALAGVAIMIMAAVVQDFLPRTSRDAASALCLIAGLVLLIGSLIMAAVRIPVLKPSRIDARNAWFTGAGDDFLSNFSSR